jgi:hypothetical protein
MRVKLAPTIVALIAVAPFAATAVLACGGSDTPPPATPVSPATSAPPTESASPATSAAPSSSGPATAASAAPSASANPLATILTTDPAQLAAIAAAAANAAAPKTQPAGSNKELESGLVASAAKVAPGMKPDGDLAAGTLKEGERLAWSVTMSPGKCYAIVGWSPKGEIKDLDLHVLGPPLYTMLTGEDETDDNAPVVGRTPNAMCPILEVGMPYKVTLTAEKGAGRAAVQLFSKAKSK